MATSWQELQKTYSPARMALIEQGIRQKDEAMLAIELGRLLEREPEEVAKELELHWPPEFPVEEYDRLPVEMLLNIVADLGGQARIEIKRRKSKLVIERPATAAKKRKTA